MEKITLELPTMYGDHHVTEVRRLLLEIPGVEDVYASSCFQVVEVTYDPARSDASVIHAALEKAGYHEDVIVPAETGVPAYGRSDNDTYFRHTQAFVQTKSIVSFSQKVNNAGRPLWPCPGFGVIENTDEEAR